MSLEIKKDLHGREIAAVDGDIGSVVDCYFDDRHWTVRYLVVDTGSWLSGHQVLISPASVSAGQPDKTKLHVDLSRDQVSRSPNADSDMPVSRQFEEAHARYYGYPFYWDGPYIWGNVQYPLGGSQPFTQPLSGDNPAGGRVRELQALEARARQSHLRSSKEVAGYRLVARDGAVGHVEDLLMDERDWSISHLLVDTRDWLPGGKVRLPVAAVEHIDWATREVRIAASRDEVKAASPPA